MRTLPARPDERPKPIWSRFGSVMFQLHGSSRHRPVRLRSSVSRAMPLAMASAGEPIFSSRPSRMIRPAVSVSTPKMARATSVRPAPTRPAMPTISPRRTSKLTSSMPASEDRPLHLHEDVADR